MKIGWRSDPMGMRPYQVTAVEATDRGGVIYLRWRAQTARGERNWRHLVPLMEVVDGGVARQVPVVLRTAQGRIIQERVRWAEEQARQQHLELVRASADPAQTVVEPGMAMLTIGETERIVCDARTGLYPRDTAHRRETQRALRFAAEVWGAARPWAVIRRAQLRELWRRRLEMLQAQGKRGGRGAEVTISRILTVAGWLRDEELIPPEAALAPRQWRQTLMDEAGNPEPQRPRYTHEEYQRLLEVAPQADPRLGLLTALGIEYRLGQVLRQRRSDLDLERGAFRVRGRGKKRGTMIRLTPGQLASARQALTTGYLRTLEESGGDYPLFPGGQLQGGRVGPGQATEQHRSADPVTNRGVRAWWAEAERLAGIEHLPGRGWYGARRIAVDLAKQGRISREGLQASGGWSDSSIPDQIYADQAMEYAQEEAMEARAAMRGEPKSKEAPPRKQHVTGTDEDDVDTLSTEGAT